MVRLTLWEPKGKLTAEIVYDVLTLGCGIGDLPSREEAGLQIRRWTPNERSIVYDWAIREHLRASDNLTVRRRPRPYLVEILIGNARVLPAREAPQ